MPTLLIVEDEAKLLKLLVRSFKDHLQWEVDSADNAEEALHKIETNPPDVVLTDIRLPGMSGLDLMNAVRRSLEAGAGVELLPQLSKGQLSKAQLLGDQQKGTPRFVVMTAYATVSSAVEALRAGAVDYLIKPFPNEELMHVLGRIENEIRLANENQNLRDRLSVYEGEGGLIGSSEPTAKLRRLIARVATTQSTVLIRGESGTGKELIARAIHEQSGRAKSPLVRVNCGAIPETLLESELFGHVKGAFTGATERRVGRFEMAGEGTLFLDEMGDLPLGLQVKLLRVLQEREYEPVGSSQTRTTQARIIAATNRDLEAAIREGSFREDLYYRLNVVTLQAPPLREHMEDIGELADHFTRRIANREALPFKQPTPAFLSALMAWNWPGNVRELENTIESALVMGEGECLEAGDLPAYITRAMTEPTIPSTSPSSTDQPGHTNAGTIDLETATLEEVERHLLVKALQESGGNQSEAARKLGITRRTLAYRREKYGL